MLIKVFKCIKGSPCYECDTKSIAQGVTLWREVTPEEYQKVNYAIQWANLNQHSDWTYFLVHEVEDNAEIFDSMDEFFEHQKKQKEQRDAEEAKRKRARAKTVKERKLKQLEKLKKELGK